MTLDDFATTPKKKPVNNLNTRQTDSNPENKSLIWNRLSSIAPSTKAVFEYAQELEIDTVSRLNIPEFLGLPLINPESDTWDHDMQSSNRINVSITNREVLLRFLLSKAIVDQGSDTPGVQQWFNELVSKCYNKNIQFFHFPVHFVERYAEVLEIAHSAAVQITENRAKEWASMQPNRKEGIYTPFNVDGMRGGKYTHWFTASRLFPAVLKSSAVSGGLTHILFEAGPPNERPLDMARERLRNDHRYGLGYGIGEKAADLFVKWAIGCLNLTPKEIRDWRPTEAVIPMDQRIGRVMMRCGFMEEFFDTELHIRKYLDKGDEPMFEKNEDVVLPEKGLPDGELFLWVRQFRRKGRTIHRNEEKTRSDAHNWCREAWRENYNTKPPRKMDPQTIVQLLCKTITTHNDILLSAAHIDDFFFDLAEDYCHDKNPRCGECTIKDVCLANTVNGMEILKKYIT